MAFLFAFIMMYILAPNAQLVTQAASNLTLNSQNVTIYGLDEDYQEYISIPSSLSTSFKFTVKGTEKPVSWSVIKGDSVEIDSNGVVTPAVTTWYWNGSWGSTVSSGAEDEVVTHEINFGTSVIQAYVDGVRLTATVKVEDYAQYYAEKTINQYIQEHINSSMTDLEKLDQICRFVAGYDYSASASGYVSMIICGGGDCWASVSCVNHMCELIGLKANYRYAANDSGAGSGHRNSTVLADGEVYLVDAGYAGSAPRYYSITPLPDGFSYESYNSGCRITQYDGFDTSIVIPSRMGERDVVAIGRDDSNLFYYNQYYNDIYVTDVSIPETVTSITTFAFSDSEQLTSVKVSPKNQNYTDINGVLFSKDKKNLVYYPNGLKGSYTIPSTTKSINEYAFYYSKKLTSVTIPEGITELKTGTFGDCNALEQVTLPNSLTTIGDFAFYNCDSLDQIVIPRSVTSISENAFNSSDLTIYGYKGTTAESYAKEHNITFVPIEKTLYNLTGVKIGGRAADALRLSWNKNSLASGYIIEQYKSGKWVRIARIANNATTTYRVENLSPSTSYKFRVQAFGFDGSTPIYGSWSSISGKTNPTVMSGVKIGGRAADALRLNWNKNATASGYIIEQYKSGKWVRIARIANNATTTYRVENLSPSTSYKFRVQAFGFDGSTALYGNSVTISGKTNPSVMSGVKIGGRAANALRLNWNKNATASGYIIEQYKSGKWVRIARIANSATTTYRVENLSPSTTYKFRVQAFGFDGDTALYGSWTTISGKTNPSIMSGVKIGGRATDALRINWNKNATASGYIIEQYKSGKWVRIARIANNATTTYRVENLSPSTTYKFRVQAFGSDGSTALYSFWQYTSGTTLK